MEQSPRLIWTGRLNDCSTRDSDSVFLMRGTQMRACQGTVDSSTSLARVPRHHRHTAAGFALEHPRSVPSCILCPLPSIHPSTHASALNQQNSSLWSFALLESIAHLTWSTSTHVLISRANNRVAIADVDTARHRDVALQAAREGIVLLQNGPEGVRHGESTGDATLRLPLDKSKHKIVAMVGPMANASMNLLSGCVHETTTVESPKAGVFCY